MHLSIDTATPAQPSLDPLVLEPIDRGEVHLEGARVGVRESRGRFVPLAPDKTDGLLKSETFPGLWLDATALVRRDLAAVLAALTRGVQSAEHAKFVKGLAAKRRPR